MLRLVPTSTVTVALGGRFAIPPFGWPAASLTEGSPESPPKPPRTPTKKTLKILSETPEKLSEDMFGCGQMVSTLVMAHGAAEKY